jgi:hypothetical protein
MLTQLANLDKILWIMLRKPSKKMTNIHIFQVKDAQIQWGLALKDCKYAGQFWVQSLEDIKKWQYYLRKCYQGRSQHWFGNL